MVQYCMPVSITHLKTRKQVKFIILWYLKNPSEMWQNSSIWKLQQQIKTVFTKKFRAN